MNVRHVSMLRDVIAEVARSSPERFDMSNWLRAQPGADLVFSAVAAKLPGGPGVHSNPQEPGCAACLAGWTQLAFAVGDDLDQHCRPFAARFLGLNPEEERRWFDPAAHRCVSIRGALEFLDQRLFEVGHDPLGPPIASPAPIRVPEPVV